MKVGVFHWAFDFFGGGEKVAMDLAEALGQKKVYTLFSEREDPEGRGIKAVDISEYLPRWARHIGKLTKSKRALEYWLWEMLDVTELGDFDVILTSGVTPRAIITQEHIMHVNYNHSVPRWLWDLWHYRWGMVKRSPKIFLFAELFRWMDVVADSRVDYYFVNSELIRRRLWKYLKRDSVILYPSIDLKKYRFKEQGDFVLHMGRIDNEKQILPVIKACEKVGVKLVLTGNAGNDAETFEYIQKHNGNGIIDFRGFVSDEEKLELLATCKAVIYNPINEDFGIIPCLPPETLIYTKEGVERISEIKEGEYVLTHKGRFRKVLKVTKRWYSGDLVKVVTYGNEPIYLTPEHLVRVVARTPSYSGHTWTPAEDLSKKDRVIFPSPMKACGKKIYDLAKFDKNLEKDDKRVWYKHSRNKLKIKRFIEISEDLCRLLGYYISEGAISQNDVVEIILGRDSKDFANDVYSLIKRVFGVEPKMRVFSNRIRVWVCSRIISKFFEKLCGRGAENKRIPYDILFHSDLNLLKALVEGMWRGDGSKYKKVYEYATVSRNLAYQLKLALVRLDKRPMIKLRQHNNRKWRDMYVIYYTDYKTKTKEHGNKAYWVGSLAYHIKRIERVPYRGYVYNLVVEEDESYVTSAFAVHNCEAFASGKPVIVNHTGYPPILIKKTGYIENDGILQVYRGGIITRGDENTIANAIKLLDRYDWNPQEIQGFAEPFDIELFRIKLREQLGLWKREFDGMLR